VGGSVAPPPGPARPVGPALTVATGLAVAAVFASDRDRLLSALGHPSGARRIWGPTGRSQSSIANSTTSWRPWRSGEGIPKPAVYVIDDPSPNAFATGTSPKRAAITATTGLLAIMNREELEGVIGHEMSHIKNYDVRLLLIVSTLIGMAGLLASVVWRSAFFTAVEAAKAGSSCSSCSPPEPSWPWWPSSSDRSSAWRCHVARVAGRRERRRAHP
jgi:hypothetical protein